MTIATILAWWKLQRRNLTFYAVPLLAILSFLDAWDNRTRGVSLWPNISTSIASSQTFVTIAFVGLSAWRARREERPSMKDLTSTLNGTRARHLFLVWLTLLTNALLSFILGAIAIGWWFGKDTTWGSPDWTIIVAAGTSVVAAVSIGFAAGIFAPYVVTPPFLALLWWYLDGAIALRDDAAQYFVPRALFQNIATSIYYAPFPGAVPRWQIWLWLGVGVFGLAVVLARSLEHIVPKLALLIAGAVVVAVPTSQLLAVDVDWERQNVPTRTFELYCDQGEIVVCVHPANKALLPEASQTIDAIMTPLLALPAVPRRATEWDPSQPLDPGQLVFQLDELASSLAPTLVTDQSANVGEALTWCQAVVASWLVIQAGFQPTWRFEYFTPEFEASFSVDQAPPENEFQQSVDRFSQLGENERSAWFQQNWQALTNGSLSCSEFR